MPRWRSRDQLQGCAKRTLLDRGALAEPGAVEAVLLVASATLVVHELGDGVEKAPRRALSGHEFGTAALALEERLHFLQSAFICRARRRRGVTIGLAQNLSTLSILNFQNQRREPEAETSR